MILVERDAQMGRSISNKSWMIVAGNLDRPTRLFLQALPGLPFPFVPVGSILFEALQWKN